MKREHQINFWYVIAAFFAILAIQDLLLAPSQVKEIPYSEFQKLAADDKVTDLVVGPNRITGTIKDGGEGNKGQRFSTVRVDPALADKLGKSGATFTGQPEPGLIANILGWFMPTLGFLLLWLFL